MESYSTHPGILLKEEFLEPLGISNYAAAKATGISQTALSEITHGKRSISVGNGLRLSRFLGMSDAYFINLQSHYETEVQRDQLQDVLATIHLSDKVTTATTA